MTPVGDDTMLQNSGDQPSETVEVEATVNADSIPDEQAAGFGGKTPLAQPPLTDDRTPVRQATDIQSV